MEVDKCECKIKLVNNERRKTIENTFERCLRLCFMVIMFIAKLNVSENLSTYFIFQPTKSKSIEDFFLEYDD